jgi:hypothetical protein
MLSAFAPTRADSREAACALLIIIIMALASGRANNAALVFGVSVVRVCGEAARGLECFRRSTI